MHKVPTDAVMTLQFLTKIPRVDEKRNTVADTLLSPAISTGREKEEGGVSPEGRSHNTK